MILHVVPTLPYEWDATLTTIEIHVVTSLGETLFP
jgi:hypothetical protein